MDDFVKTMSDLEIVVMRHQAKEAGDAELIALLDEELRIREKRLNASRPASIQGVPPNGGDA